MLGILNKSLQIIYAPFLLRELTNLHFIISRKL